MVTMTERAATEISGLLQTQNKVDHKLRVWIAGGGCSGFQYGMALDDQVADDDVTFDSHGVTVLVDPMSHQYLDGAEIDFVETVMGGGFKVNNPNAAGGCGCGSGGCGSGCGESSGSEAGCGCGSHEPAHAGGGCCSH